MLEIINLPKEFYTLWEKCIPFLEKGRPGDLEHAKDTVEFILNYKGNVDLDEDILIPMAMMHDIGHSAILQEHFKYVTGPEKIENGKLVHMLTGAKIAQDLLEAIDYNKQITKQIVNMISVHDFEQLNIENAKAAYDTPNKKIFHDIDILDRFNNERIEKMKKVYPDRQKILELIKEDLNNFFFDEFRQIAQQRFQVL